MANLAGIDCVGYVRVSTDKQVGEVYTSLADQRAAITVRAGKRPVGAWFVDDGASGGSAEGRPAFMELVASCEGAPRPLHAPGLVLALNDSRWGRFPVPEESAYWRIRLAKSGWQVRYVEHDDIEDQTLRTVMRAIGGAQASHHRESIRANAKRGMRGTTGQGFWASMAPFGYRRKVVWPVGRERVLEGRTRKASDEKIVLVPHAAEAKIVRALFTRYAAGTESLDSLTDWLMSVWPQRKWAPAGVRFILRNPAYVGDVVFGRKPADPHERKVRGGKRPPSEWYGKPDAHEPIVSRELFAQVQARFAINKRQTKGTRREWVVSGLVSCRCGKHFVAGGSMGRGGRSPSYRCMTRGKNSQNKCAYRGAVLKPWLESAVIGTIAEVVGGPTLHSRLEKMLDAEIAKLRASPASVRERLTEQLHTVEAKRERLVTAIENGTIASTEAAARMAQLRAEAQRLRGDLDRLDAPAQAIEALEGRRALALALVRDFPRLAGELHGAALRELLRPWIQSAVFDTDTRRLRMEIRLFPEGLLGDSENMPRQTKQHHVVVRTVRVGGLR